MTEPVPQYRRDVDLNDPTGSGTWVAYAGAAVIGVLYWLLLVTPLYGSEADPNCRVYCPDLNLSWYPLSFAPGDGSASYTAMALFVWAPCVAVPLLVGLVIHFVNNWKSAPVRLRAARAVALFLLGAGLILTYARFNDITGWLAM
jgi:hypothetical protein